MQKITLLLSLLVLLAACNKKEDENKDETTPKTTVFPNTEAEMQTTLQQEWGNSTFILESVGNQDCRNDDKMTLKADGTYSYDGRQFSCGGDDVAYKIGVWEADYNAKTIIFDKGTADEYIADIVSLSDTEMRVRGNWSGLDIEATYKIF